MLKRFYSTAPKLSKTALYDLHVSLGADLTEFAGYSMPVLYKGQTHIESHNWTRQHAGLFDVSHMLQHKIVGKDALRFLNKSTPSDFESVKPYHSQYSAILNHDGGIVDDTIITKHEGNEDFYIVTNAGTRQRILDYFYDEAQGYDVKFEQIKKSLLAIQGPTAQKVLQKFVTDDLSKIYFGQAKYVKLPSFNNTVAHVSRGGYTGEDGFEVSIPDEIAVDFAKALLEDPELEPIGLAARDSLRLEAGMCLYGSDLNFTINPVQASLSWIIAKNRRDPKSKKSEFNGSINVLAQLEDRSLLKTQRIGFTSKGPAPREGFDIYDFENPDKLIGVVTSGAPSPSLPGRVNVGMGYVDRGYHKAGTKVLIDIRDKKREAVVAKTPFVETHYYREP